MAISSEDFEPFTFSYGFFIALFFIMTWGGLFPSVIMGYFYFKIFPFSFDPLYLLLLIPMFIILYGIALASSLLTTKLGIWVVHKRIAYPIPGSYNMSMDEPQTRAWVLKGNIKNFGRWLFYLPHLSFLQKFWMRRMGLKIGKRVKLGEYILDDDFIEIGDNTFFARDCIVSGHLMDQSQLTLNPTIIGKNCIFESFSGSVGGTIGDNSIFKFRTGVMKGQICKGDAIYQGFPAKKIADNDLSPEALKDLITEIRESDKNSRYDLIKIKNAPIKISGIKLFFSKLCIILGGCLLAGLLIFLIYLFYKGTLSTTNDLWNIFLLALLPIIFFVTLGFFIAGTTIFTKIFLLYYDRKAEISEGYYELDDPYAKIFKTKYFLRLFGLGLFRSTFFKIADTFAMRLWGTVNVGQYSKLEDAIVDPQYLEVGDNTQIGAGARVHTHDIINGKLYFKKVILGNNVLVGAFTHIKPGVELVDGTITAVATWLEKDLKTEKPALWLGKPAIEYPLSKVTKSAKLDGKSVD